jgi:hypothetical protein
MNVIDVINKINHYDVVVKYDSKEDVTRRFLEGNSMPIYFTPVEGKERIKFEKNQRRDFVSNSAAIHIPDLAVDEMINLFECDVTGILNHTKEYLKKYLRDDIDENIVIISFIFLHEVGHWKQFCKMSCNVWDFINDDLELEKENFEKRKVVLESRKERLQRGNNCILTVKERKKLNEIMEEYRNIPKEKDADIFAIFNMDECLNILIQK